MKNLFIPPAISYVIVCILAVLAPASEGYDSFIWKLLIGQIFAIPVFIVVALVNLYVIKKYSM